MLFWGGIAFGFTTLADLQANPGSTNFITIFDDDDQAPPTQTCDPSVHSPTPPRRAAG